MPCGIIIIDKPAGWTSQDVAAKLRGVFRERRVGHGGTLDPMATGVLPIFIGRATRGVEFFESAEKEYIAGLRLGLTTNTQDTTGEVLDEQPVSVTGEQLREILTKFLGKQEQVPPMYSAVKIGGKKLYELARQGKTVERKARAIEIKELELLDGEGCEFRIRVRCSKGTYVRTLCHDIGQALGCGGCMSSLRRTMAGTYRLAQAVTMDELLRQEDPEALLLPVDSLFAEYPAHTVQDNQLKAVFNGAAVKAAGLPDGTYRVYDRNGTFLLVGQAEKGMLKTVKSFFEVKTGE
ncbi:MAG: tRNA pseudouridine(55) synthase TruB [Oscillibacter sp.]|nr:tRNA pseudouridine(55) synthase TruB [Oscillibacter sp.]